VLAVANLICKPLDLPWTLISLCRSSEARLRWTVDIRPLGGPPRDVWFGITSNLGQGLRWAPGPGLRALHAGSRV